MVSFFTKKSRYLLCIILLVSACEGSWLGERDTKILKGERISVLVHEKNLAADELGKEAEIILPAPEDNKAWSQSGGLSNHAMQHIAVNDQIVQVWKKNVGKGKTSRNRLLSEPVVADGKIFTIDSVAKISALNLDNGKKVWDSNIAAKGSKGNVLLGGGIAFDKSRIFATTGLAEVLCLNANDGTLLWRNFVGAPVHSSPSVNGGRIFIVTVDNRLIALAAKDGKELWNYDAGSEMTNLLGGAVPAVDNGVVVAAFSSGEIGAFQVDTGRLLWSDNISSVKRTDAISSMSGIIGSPVVDRGLVYVIGNNKLMAAIDIRNGSRVWEREIGGISQPWVAGNYIFVLTNDHEITAVEAESGRIVWVTPLDKWEDANKKKNRLTWSGPIMVSDRLIIASSNGKVLSVSPYDGALIGFEEFSDGISVPPIAAQKMVFFLTDNADVIAFR